MLRALIIRNLEILMGCERGGPLQKCKSPKPPKVLGKVLREVPARNGVLGDVLGEGLGKVLALIVATRDARDKHFSKHFPENPVSGWRPPRALRWGVLGFCSGPPRSQSWGSLSGDFFVPQPLAHAPCFHSLFVSLGAPRLSQSQERKRRTKIFFLARESAGGGSLPVGCPRVKNLCAIFGTQEI